MIRLSVPNKQTCVYWFAQIVLITEAPSIILMVVLILFSAFFSGSETSMMAINRYRLKHLVKEKNKSAKRVTKLLGRTDRLLGVILIGNNFTHTLATAIATVIAIRIWSDSAVLAVTVFMTIITVSNTHLTLPTNREV